MIRRALRDTPSIVPQVHIPRDQSDARINYSQNTSRWRIKVLKTNKLIPACVHAWTRIEFIHYVIRVNMIHLSQGWKLIHKQDMERVAESIQQYPWYLNIMLISIICIIILLLLYVLLLIFTIKLLAQLYSIIFINIIKMWIQLNFSKWDN